MSGFAELEAAVAEVLGGLQVDGAALFASVRRHGPLERAAVADVIGRERKPAALIVVSGRGPVGGNDPSGRPTLSVFVDCRSLRGQEDARTSAGGLHAVLDATARSLHRALFPRDRRLLLVRERGIVSDGRRILWEQAYEVRRECSVEPPRFNGAALCGPQSDVSFEPGPLERPDDSASAGSGTSSAPRQTIAWRGTLRADDDDVLNAIEADIEAVVRSGAAGELVDPWGRLYQGFVAASFVRRGPRGRDDVTDEAVQDFELRFIRSGS